MEKIIIAIGCDHAGVHYKEALVAMLLKRGCQVINHGTDTEESVDYPDFVHPVAVDIERGKADFGIIICGSGNGAAITANKHQKIRAAIAWNGELAKLARQHNDANIISIPSRFVSLEEAKTMVAVFLNTTFEGGRHQRRVQKIAIT